MFIGRPLTKVLLPVEVPVNKVREKTKTTNSLMTRKSKVRCVWVPVSWTAALSGQAHRGVLHQHKVDKAEERKEDMQRTPHLVKVRHCRAMPCR